MPNWQRLTRLGYCLLLQDPPGGSAWYQQASYAQVQMHRYPSLAVQRLQATPAPSKASPSPRTLIPMVRLSTTVLCSVKQIPVTCCFCSPGLSRSCRLFRVVVQLPAGSREISACTVSAATQLDLQTSGICTHEARGLQHLGALVLS